jgi:hypothetical protein
MSASIYLLDWIIPTRRATGILSINFTMLSPTYFQLRSNRAKSAHLPNAQPSSLNANEFSKRVSYHALMVKSAS